jgi:hypothetical protein
MIIKEKDAKKILNQLWKIIKKKEKDIIKKNYK